MSKRGNGGHAFPTDAYYDERRHGVEEGMSLRDYFAAKALAGWLASFDGDTPHPAVLLGADDEVETKQERARRRCASLAQMSYDLADAMLAERGKR
jgi:hypothetical protein